MFNTNEFAWKDISFRALGRKITGCTGVEYTVERDTEYLHTTGDEPQSIQEGNKRYPGTLTITQSELRAMDNLAKAEGYNDVTDLPPFDLVVKYKREKNSDVQIDLVRSLKINGVPKNWSQNQYFLGVPLAFKALKVTPNVTL